MSGLGKGVLGVVGISRNEGGAGTFPDITPSLRHFASKCAVVAAGDRKSTRLNSSHAILTVLNMSGFMAWKPSYGDAEVAGFLFTYSLE